MQHNNYEILEHPADAKFLARGESLEQAFAHAAQAMFSIMLDVDDCADGTVEQISLQAEDKESLLYDFLDQLIYLRDVKSRLYFSFNVSINQTESGYELKAEIEGCPLDNVDRYTEVKAVTYNEMEVKWEQGQWLIKTVLDI